MCCETAAEISCLWLQLSLVPGPSLESQLTFTGLFSRAGAGSVLAADVELLLAGTAPVLGVAVGLPLATTGPPLATTGPADVELALVRDIHACAASITS